VCHDPLQRQIVPDCQHGTSRDASRLGASTIVEWVNTNIDRVHIAPTTPLPPSLAAMRQARLSVSSILASKRQLNMRGHVHLEPDERAVLLSKDRKVTAIRLAREEAPRAIIITVRDFLITLERIGRINSADAVYDTVVAAGRTPSRRELLDQHNPLMKDAIARLLGSKKTGRTNHRPDQLTSVVTSSGPGESAGHLKHIRTRNTPARPTSGLTPICGASGSAALRSSCSRRLITAQPFFR
jgi:hypothetical protein